MAIWAQADPSPTLHTIGFVGFSTALGSTLSSLPVAITVFAGLMGGISYTLTVIQNPAIQKWMTQRKLRRDARKLARLRANRERLQGDLLALDHMLKAKEEAKTIVAASRVEADTIARESTDELKKH